MRREWLTGIIREVHVASRGTYGYRRVHAELTQAHGVFVSANLVNLLMHNAAITGLPGLAKLLAIQVFRPMTILSIVVSTVMG